VQLVCTLGTVPAGRIHVLPSREVLMAEATYAQPGGVAYSLISEGGHGRIPRDATSPQAKRLCSCVLQSPLTSAPLHLGLIQKKRQGSTDMGITGPAMRTEQASEIGVGLVQERFELVTLCQGWRTGEQATLNTLDLDLVGAERVLHLPLEDRGQGVACGATSLAQVATSGGGVRWG